METAELFTQSVASLPEAARRRIDGDAPLDWDALEDPATGAAVSEAARGGCRLPESAETLAARLIREVGIVPADLAAGRERECRANAWLRRISVEPDGERYRLRNRRSAEVHAGIRPEALAGYMLLALELATLVDEAARSWIEAGDRYPAAAEGEPAPLARCAIRIGARLKAPAGPDRGSTGSLASTLEDAWNAQSPEIREVLAIEPVAAPGACAPRLRHYTPGESHRLEAFDPAGLRWLCALGERALEEAPPDERRDASPDASANDSSPGAGDDPARDTIAAASAAPEADPDEIALGRELAELQSAAERLPSPTGPAPRTRAANGSGDDVAALELTALEAQVQAETVNALDLGSRPDGIAADEALAGLRRAVARLPAPVRRRLGESHGIGVAQALIRLRDPGEADAAFAELHAAVAARQAPAWLEELAASLLADAGAQARDGARTGSLSLELPGGPDGYSATETETGFQGRLTLPDLVEQLHLGLTYAGRAWTGIETLRTAGTDSAWTLGEASNGSSLLSATEREMLEAARQIERILDRTRIAAPPDGPPSALEQASMAARAIATVGPTVRAAAGWPGALRAPDPRDPDDVARIAAFAEALHEAVKSISNRMIAGEMAVDET